MSVRVRAFAKVNLGLSVVSRRPDGFHDIDTLFQSIDLADTLVLEESAAGMTVSARGLVVPLDESNLAWRAAEAVRSETGCPPVSIDIHKRIPVAAGLGGGSADAAGTLLGMCSLFDLDLTDGDLKRLALGIGSDVPFMLRGGTARGRGRGENLEWWPGLSGFALVLVTPPVPVSAGEAYAAARIGLTRQALFTKLNCSAIQEGDMRALLTALRNDLEPGVVSCCPEVAAVRRALERAGALAVQMSGSGPTVFGLAGSREDAEVLAGAIRMTGDPGWSIHVAEPIDSGCWVGGAKERRS